ncbi:MAG: GAF domain-containing protein [Chloroflexi bacterium]|nr:GAF domain-containing protein [Chloroflexota bacterium]
MSLQWKAGLYGGIGLLLLIAVLASLGVQAVNKSVRRSLDERVLTAQTAAQSVDQLLGMALDDLQRLAARRAWASGLTEPVPDTTLLNDFYGWWAPTATLAFLLDGQGKVVQTEPPHPEWLDRPLAADPQAVEALKDGAPRVSAAFASGVAPGQAFSLLVPVLGPGGGLVAVLGVQLDLARNGIAGLIDPVGLGTTAYAEIVDEGGRVLASTKSDPGTTGQEKTEYADHLAGLVKARRATRETCYRCHDTAGGQQRRRDVLAFAPLATVSGGVAIRQTESEALASSQELKRDMLITGGVILAVGIALIWLVTRGLVHPLAQLTAAARRIAGGDFHTSVTSDRNDELGELATSFERMRLSLRESLAQKEERVRESEERARQLSALNALVTTVSRSLDLSRILEDGLDQALRTMYMDAGAIWLSEGSPPRLTLKVQQGASSSWLTKVPQMNENAPFSGVLLRQNDTPSSSADEPRFFVHIPLVSKGSVLGVMVLASRDQRQFNPQEQELLAAFGHQLGVGVENAQLFQQSQKREREVQALNQINVDISRLLDLDQILHTVVESARHLLEADAAVLSLWDEANREVYVHAVSGALDPALTTLRLRPGEGIAGSVFATGHALVSQDYLTDPNLPHRAEEDSLLRKAGLRGWLAVPMKVGEETLGSLAVANQRAQPFHDREVELLRQLANQAAVAIENARLYAQVGEVAVLQERQRIAREMHDSVGQVLAYLGLRLRDLEGLVGTGKTAQAQERITEAKKVVEDTYQEVREGILALRSAGSPQMALVPMLESYLADYRHRTGVAATLVVADQRATQFPPRVAVQLVRVVQEALANVHKHARASKVEVRFQVAAQRAVITVDDNGVGFDPESRALGAPSHFGIQVMQERMESVGGSLTIRSRPGAGTQVIAELPLA